MFSFRLLGAVDLVDSDGRQASSVLAHRKQAALLAVLVLADGGVVRRDRLLGLLWPELPTDRARNALSKAIHGLRTTLGTEALKTGPGDEVRLSPGLVRCDVVELLSALDGAEAEAALPRLAGTELLEGFHLAEAQAFDEWLEEQRSRLRRTALEAALSRAGAAEERGPPEAAVRWLEHALSVDPFDEELIRRLVTAHARAGDRAGALAAYRRFADRLASTFDVEPSASTTALVEGVRAGRVEPYPAPLAAPMSPWTEVGPIGPVRRPSAGRWRSSIAVVGVATISLAVLLPAWRGGPVAASEDRVLVAPLELDAPDSSLTGFDLVAADWLTLALTRQGNVQVVPARLAHAQLRGSDRNRESVLGLAREVGARWVVTGQVRRVADSVLVLPQILDSREGVVAQALEPIGGAASDPGALLVPLADRVSGAVAARLDRRVPRAASGPARPPDYRAYLEFIAAIEPWARAGSARGEGAGAADFARAAEHFRRAHALDPDFLSMLPWMWEALTLSGAREEARALLDRIVARRDDLGAYEVSVVDFLDRFRKGDREGAYDAARRRVELAPYDGDALWSLGWAAVNTNRFDESVRVFEAAENKGGWMGDWANFVQWPARALHLRGDYEAEAALVARFLDRFPDGLSFCDHGLRPLLAQGDSAPIAAAVDSCVNERSDDPVAMAQLLLGVSMELRAHGRSALATRYADSVVAVIGPEIAAAPELRGLRRIRFEALLVSGRWAELVTVAEEDPDPQVMWANRWGPFGIAAAELGDSARVRTALARVRQSPSSPADSAWAHLTVGAILAHLGRLDDAVDEIRAAVAGGLSPAELFHAQRSLEPLLGHRDYDAIIAPRR